MMMYALHVTGTAGGVGGSRVRAGKGRSTNGMADEFMMAFSSECFLSLPSALCLCPCATITTAIPYSIIYLAST